RLILKQHGDVEFLQQLALLGSIYGFVDLLVKPNGTGEAATDHAGQAAKSPTEHDADDPTSDAAPASSPLDDAGASSGGPATSAHASPEEWSSGPVNPSPALDDDPRPRAATASEGDADLSAVARRVRWEI